MKKILIVLLCSIITLSVTAQTITITFAGTNRNRNYRVVVDGTSYFSNSSIAADNTNASVRKNVILSNQRIGSHSIAVYRLRDNRGTNNNGTTTNNERAIYSKTFELREGYDMDIKITGSGQVTFSEKRIRNRGNRGGNIQSMSEASFNQLVQSVNNQRLQSQKLVTIRNAFANTSNYFSTGQVRQLLVLINSEANRLSLAKAAYPKVTDPANFTMLYDVFNRVASRDEMNAFIRNNPNNNDASNNNMGNSSNTTGNNTYRTAMAEYQFNQLIQNVNNQYTQSSKYQVIRDAFNTTIHYYSSTQVRQLLSLINAESDRLALAKMAYLRVSDATNFSVVYDLFYNQSYRNELNNYVLQNGGTGINTQTTSRIAMSDDAFAQVLQKARNHFFPWDVVRDVRAAFNNTDYYFNTAQIRQLLSIVSSQSERLELAKLSWRTVTDPSNFPSLYDLFTTQASRDDLANYIAAHPGS